MVKYFLLASTIISGAMALALPASAAMTGVEVTRSNPAVVDTITPNSTLLVQVADDDDQGDDNDDQGDDNDDQGEDEQ